jgi:uncharacterized membrane protein YkgB
MSKLQTFSRISLFIIYFWFGILKVFSLSPATPLVEALEQKTLSSLPFSAAQFVILFGIFEVIIGILFLLPIFIKKLDTKKFTKITKLIFAFHMVTTFMPLVILPYAVFTGPLVPTLEGQYIVKNLALIVAVAIL